MLEIFKGKKVTVTLTFAKRPKMRDVILTEVLEGVLTNYDNEGLILNNTIYISRRWLIKIEL